MLLNPVITADLLGSVISTIILEDLGKISDLPHFMKPIIGKLNLYPVL